MSEWATALRLLFRRRIWALVLTTGLVLLIAVLLTPPQGKRYTAEAILFVPSGATREGPGNAFDANRLALTYVSLIPRDDAIFGHIARTISEPVSTVRGQLKVSTVGDTAIMRVTYTSSSAAQSRVAVRAAAQAITGEARAAETIPPRTVVLASLGEQAPTQPPATSTVIGFGAVLGLALGFVVAVASERAAPRVDGIAQLDELAPYPTSPLDELSAASATALLNRLKALANSDSRSRSTTSVKVALVAASPGQLELNREVGRLLSLLATVSGLRCRSDSPADSETDVQLSDQDSSHLAAQDEPIRAVLTDIELVPAGAPTDGEGGELVALGSDLTVLIVVAGTRVADFRQTIRRLEEFEIALGWVLFVSARARKALPGASDGAAQEGVRRRRSPGIGRASAVAPSPYDPEDADPSQRAHAAARTMPGVAVNGTPEAEPSEMERPGVPRASSEDQATASEEATPDDASAVGDASGDEYTGMSERLSTRLAEEAWANVLNKVDSTPQAVETKPSAFEGLGGSRTLPAESADEVESLPLESTPEDARGRPQGDKQNRTKPEEGAVDEVVDMPTHVESPESSSESLSPRSVPADAGGAASSARDKPNTP